jgi:hypothetical protein
MRAKYIVLGIQHRLILAYTVDASDASRRNSGRKVLVPKPIVNQLPSKRPHHLALVVTLSVNISKVPSYLGFWSRVWGTCHTRQGTVNGPGEFENGQNQPASLPVPARKSLPASAMTGTGDPRAASHSKASIRGRPVTILHSDIISSLGPACIIGRSVAIGAAGTGICLQDLKPQPRSQASCRPRISSRCYAPA